MSSSHPPQQPADVDPISKFKMLVPHLKDSLGNLMKLSGQAFNQNAQVDSCAKIGEATSQRFDKSLEEFYAICDQIELSLKLATECYNQCGDSNKNTPAPLTGGKPDVPTPTTNQTPTATDTISYSQYLATVKMQINCAKEVHDALVECARKIKERQAP